MTAPSETSLAPGQRVLRSRGVSLRWRPRTLVVCAVLALACAVFGALGMMTGSTPLEFSDLLAAFDGSAEPTVTNIVLNVRMPRVVAGIAVGAALAVSGATFQSLSRNALGSPDIIGFVTGAATGAIVAITLFQATGVVVAVAAVASGIVTALLVFVLSAGGRGDAGYRLILVGIGAGAFLSAINGFLLTRSTAETAVAAQIWLTGTLNSRTWAQAITAVVAFALIAPVLVVLTRSLDVMELGDDFAAGVGVRTHLVRRTALLVAVVLAAVATAVCGPISFVALAAPHIARRLLAAPGVPVVGSALMGAALLVGADLAAQTLPFGLRVPVALMTGVLGGIYLIWLLTRRTTRI